MFVTDDAMLLSIITQGSLSHITLDSITASGDPDRTRKQRLVSFSRFAVLGPLGWRYISWCIFATKKLTEPSVPPGVSSFTVSTLQNFNIICLSTATMAPIQCTMHYALCSLEVSLGKFTKMCTLPSFSHSLSNLFSFFLLEFPL